MNIFQKKKNKKLDEQIASLNNDLSDYKLSDDIEENLALFQKIFENNDNLRIRKIANGSNPKIYCYIVFFNGMVDSKIINDNIIKPFTEADLTARKNLFDTVLTQIVQIGELNQSSDVRQIVESATSGDTILLLEKENRVMILNTKGYVYRAISEPDSEKILAGPREGFTESLIVNISMLQRKFRTNQFKTKYMGIGKATNTNVCVCYIESVVNRDVLNEVIRRLEQIDIDAVLDSNYLLELIDDPKYSPFKRINTTERPDAVVGKLLEGRVAVLVDGTPVTLTMPYLFIENFQSPEDYYLASDYSSISRIIRIFGFFLTVCTPALYIAVESFHQEMIPTSLFINIAIERENAPLPTALEVIVMLVVFELLKETGVRMPTKVGDALSIVGALVIGQAAVEAELVAAPMIIVVGITGISSLLVTKLNSAIILYRFLILVITIFMGFLGFVLGLSIMIINILNQTSFGVPQLEKIDSLNPQDIKDQLIRRSWRNMITRPEYLSNNKIRQNKNNG